MSDTTTVEQPRGTVFFERTVNLGDYNSTKVGISVQFPVSWDESTGAEKTTAAAKDAFFQAKVVVLEQLNIKAQYDSEAGVIREAIEKTFPGTTNVTPAALPAVVIPDNVTAPAPSAQPAAAPAGGVACPICQGAMYDNRATKTNPKQPDYRCKAHKPELGGCKGVIWPPRA